MTIMSLSELVTFTNLQAQALDALERLYPTSMSTTPLSVPRQGEIQVSNDSFAFTRHGSGVRFTSLVSGHIIDAHKIYLGMHDAVDSWRILQFLESLGVDSITEQAVEESLQHYVKKGELIKTNYPGVYVLDREATDSESRRIEGMV